MTPDLPPVLAGCLRSAGGGGGSVSTGLPGGMLQPACSGQAEIHARFESGSLQGPRRHVQMLFFPLMHPEGTRRVASRRPRWPEGARGVIRAASDVIRMLRWAVEYAQPCGSCVGVCVHMDCGMSRLKRGPRGGRSSSADSG